jgi:hypothetical protein
MRSTYGGLRTEVRDYSSSMPYSDSAAGLFEESSLRSSVTAIVCAGPSCRGAGRTKLCSVLHEAGLEVEASGCLGICDGPVAAAPIGNRWEVIRKVNDKRRRSRLVAAVMSGQRSKLRGRLVAGSRRKKALRRVLKSHS